MSIESISSSVNAGNYQAIESEEVNKKEEKEVATEESSPVRTGDAVADVPTPENKV